MAVAAVKSRGKKAERGVTSKGQSFFTDYERLSVGIDMGTSHDEAVVYGKTSDESDEKKYHYSSKPLDLLCLSSQILFANDNESSIQFLLKFQKKHQLANQVEFIHKKEIPYLFEAQIQELLRSGNILLPLQNANFEVKGVYQESELDRSTVYLNRVGRGSIFYD